MCLLAPIIFAVCLFGIAAASNNSLRTPRGDKTEEVAKEQQHRQLSPSAPPTRAFDYSKFDNLNTDSDYEDDEVPTSRPTSRATSRPTEPGMPATIMFRTGSTPIIFQTKFQNISPELDAIWKGKYEPLAEAWSKLSEKQLLDNEDSIKEQAQTIFNEMKAENGGKSILAFRFLQVAVEHVYKLGARVQYQWLTRILDGVGDDTKKWIA